MFSKNHSLKTIFKQIGFIFDKIFARNWVVFYQKVVFFVGIIMCFMSLNQWIVDCSGWTYVMRRIIDLNKLFFRLFNKVFIITSVKRFLQLFY